MTQIPRAVYLDNHSSTKTDDRVLAAMLPFFQSGYGNAQSMHSVGARSKEALEKARHQAAGLIGAAAADVYFTSCGSESNTWALEGVVHACAEKRRHVIVSAVEHVSILNAAKKLSRSGTETTLLPVDRFGTVDPENLRKAIRDDTIIVSVQHANPEIGTIQPLAELVRVTREKNKKTLFHTDAVAGAPVLPIDVKNPDVDLLTMASDQIYGPKGAALLYAKKGTKIQGLIQGGVQEAGKRAGTENIPAIAGFGEACRILLAERAGNARKMAELRDRLITALPRRIEHAYLNGHPEERLANNVNFSIEFIEGEGMLLLLDERGIYLTSGSACTSKQLKMSHVLAATGVDPAVSQGSLVMTLARDTAAEDLDYVLAELEPIVKKLRQMSPLYAYFLKTGRRHQAGPGTDYGHEHEHEPADGDR